MLEKQYEQTLLDISKENKYIKSEFEVEKMKILTIGQTFQEEHINLKQETIKLIEKELSSEKSKYEEQVKDILERNRVETEELQAKLKENCAEAEDRNIQFNNVQKENEVLNVLLR